MFLVCGLSFLSILFLFLSVPLCEWDDRKQAKREFDLDGKMQKFIFRVTSGTDLAELTERFSQIGAKITSSSLRLSIGALDVELKGNQACFRSLRGKSFWSRFNKRRRSFISAFEIDLTEARLLWLGKSKNSWNCPTLIWKHPGIDDEPGLSSVSASEFMAEVLRRREDYKKLDFSDLNLPGAEFSELNLDRLEIFSACLQRSRFASSSLREADFKGSDLRRANFQKADLVGADFEDCELAGADFQGAILCGASFFGADVRAADFRGADLRSTNLNCLNREQALFDPGLPEPKPGSPGGAPLSYSAARGTISINSDGLYCDFGGYTLEWEEYQKELLALNLRGWRSFALTKLKPSPPAGSRDEATPALSLKITIKNHLHIDHPKYEDCDLYAPPPKPYWEHLELGSECGWLARDYGLRHRYIESVEWVHEPACFGWPG